MKATLADNDAALNDEAGAAYIENFAFRVFVQADNEDRAGKASRLTAKNFLAAANFLDLLSIFGAVAEEVSGTAVRRHRTSNSFWVIPAPPQTAEKKKYAKWKASEIAKAIKEGRKPAPGPPGWDPQQDKKEKEEEEAALEEIKRAEDDDDLLAKEIARLTAPTDSQQTPEEAFGRALSPDAEPGTGASSRRRDSRIPARLPFDTSIADSAHDSDRTLGAGSSIGLPTPSTPPPQSDSEHNSFLPSTNALSSPNFSHPLRPQLQRGLSNSSAAHSVNDASTSSADKPATNQAHDSPSTAFLNVPSAPDARLTGLISPINSPTPGEVTAPGRPLPIPPGGVASPQPPSIPPSHSGSGDFFSSGDTSRQPPAGGYAAAPSAPPEHSLTQQPATSIPAQTILTPENAPQLTAPEELTNPAEPVLPTTLNSKQTSKAQRLAKFAISALDYEDLETARRNLRLALDVVEGRDLAA